MTGLTLSEWLRARASGAARKSPRALGVIQVYLAGGPSHLETYDPKPDAPREYRGEFEAIQSNVPGLRLSEHLRQQARLADRLVVARGLHHATSDHAEGAHWILTGHPPRQSTPRGNERASTGSVVSHFGESRGVGVPRYIAMPEPPPFGYAAELGPGANPFSPQGDLATGNLRIANLDPPREVTPARLEDRRALLARLDRLDPRRDPAGVFAGLDRFAAEAHAMITGPAARSAFDLDQEPGPLRDRYGRTAIGQGCLLARRLIEAGVAFVTITEGGWDHHGQVFEGCRRQLPPLDQALGALLDDLRSRGLSDQVLVLVWGEFGRTPRVNGQSGRDHWPGAFSALLSGGGLRGGFALGATDRRGENPVERPIIPEDIIHTVYHVLGIDPKQSSSRDSDRPSPLLERGAPIREILA